MSENSDRQHQIPLQAPEISMKYFDVIYVCFLLFFVFVYFFQIYKLPISAYVQDINVDDSFYYYIIARNFSDGLFSSADGVNITNGYHPLWAWLLVPVFGIVEDPITALRVSKMVELVLLLFAAINVMLAGRYAGWRPITSSIVLVWFYCTPVFFIGLEAAAQVFLLTALMYLLVRLLDNPRSSAWIALSVCCAVLPWVRLECVAIGFAAATIVHLYMAIWRPKAVGLGVAVLWFATIGGMAAYLLYNQLAFGTLVPVSGQVKAYWSQVQFQEEGGYSFIGNAIVFLKTQRVVTAAVLASLLVVVVSWLSAEYRRSRHADHGIDAFLICLAAGHFGRMLFSALSLDIIYDAGWYYIPGKLAVAFVFPLIIGRGACLLRLWGFAPRIASQQSELVVGVGALVAVLLVLQPYSRLAAWRQGWRPDWQAASYEGAQWMNENLPRQAIVGSPDSGIVGYFAHQRVINLDGLVNSKEFLAAVKSQTVEAWIRQQGIEYFANAMWNDMDSCEFMAKASAQTARYPGPCRDVFKGNITFENRWEGRVSPMSFKVLKYE